MLFWGKRENPFPLVLLFPNISKYLHFYGLVGYPIPFVFERGKDSATTQKHFPCFCKAKLQQKNVTSYHKKVVLIHKKDVLIMVFQTILNINKLLTTWKSISYKKAICRRINIYISINYAKNKPKQKYINSWKSIN